MYIAYIHLYGLNLVIKLVVLVTRVPPVCGLWYIIIHQI